jgi:hypothetical protein
MPPDAPGPTPDTDLARLEREKLRAEIRKLEVETRKIARETIFYPIVAGTGLILAIVAVAKLFR